MIINEKKLALRGHLNNFFKTLAFIVAKRTFSKHYIQPSKHDHNEKKFCPILKRTYDSLKFNSNLPGILYYLTITFIF